MNPTKQKVNSISLHHPIAVINSIYVFILALNYLYDEFGSKISVHLIGPFKQPTNQSHDSVFIRMQVGETISVTKHFDIARANDNQKKLDIVAFDFDLGIDKVHDQLNVSFQITTNTRDGIPFQLHIDTHSLDTQIGAICGGVILILLNVLIITEV